MRRCPPQAAVGDADAVLQVEAPQLPATAHDRDDVVVGDVSAAGQAEREQVGTPVEGAAEEQSDKSGMAAAVALTRLASGHVVICMRGVCGIRMFGEGLALSKQHLTDMCTSVHFYSRRMQSSSSSSSIEGQRREV